jgi:hypothetical protein
MPEFITIKSGKKKIGLNLDLIVAFEYTADDDKEPTLTIGFSVPKEDTLVFSGQEATDIGKYLDGIAYDIPRSRRK